MGVSSPVLSFFYTSSGSHSANLVLEGGIVIVERETVSECRVDDTSEIGAAKNLHHCQLFITLKPFQLVEMCITPVTNNAHHLTSRLNNRGSL